MAIRLGENITSNNVVRTMIASERAWKLIHKFITTVMQDRERKERELKSVQGTLMD